MQSSHNGLSLASTWLPSTLSPHRTSDDHETHRSSISARIRLSPHKCSQSSTADRTATVVPEPPPLRQRPSSPVPVGGSACAAGFELAATGKYMMQRLSDVLSDRCLRMRPQANRPATSISKKHLARVLRDRYYLGFVNYKR